MLIQGAKLGKLVGDQLTITIPLHTVEELKKFKPDDLVSIEIKRPKDKRSSQQNRYIWEIISQIDQKINGYDSDEWTIYKQLLRQAKIKTLYFETTSEAKTHYNRPSGWSKNTNAEPPQKALKPLSFAATSAHPNSPKKK